MSIRSRITKLEQAIVAPVRTKSKSRCDEEWLATYEELGRKGRFDHEPDFPKALALYREGLTLARASVDPPFDPPPEYEMAHHDLELRAQLWRDRYQFPVMHAGREWLGEMLHRKCRGIPPVTESEFAELAAWFRAHEPRIRAMSELLDVDGWRNQTHLGLRMALDKGPRAREAGGAADAVRKLKSRIGQ